MEKLNEEETIHFEVSESCYICNQYFTAAVSSSILRTIGSRTRKKFAKVLVEKLLKIGSNFPDIKSVYLKEWKLDTSILSKKHELFTVIRKKKAFSRFDSKCRILSCGIHSLPFNSFLIDKYGNRCPRC